MFVKLFQQGSKKNQHWILRRNCASESRNFLAGLMWGQPRVATAKLSNPENQLKSCYHWWLSHHSGRYCLKKQYIRELVQTTQNHKPPLKISVENIAPSPNQFRSRRCSAPKQSHHLSVGPVVQPYHHLLNEDFQTHP